MTPEHIEFIGKLQGTANIFDMLKMNDKEKVEVAEAAQKVIDWMRFRAGVDKECFECRLKNSPEATSCVNPKCLKIFVCEPCRLKQEETKVSIWRCRHAGGFRSKEVIKMIYRTRAEGGGGGRDDDEPRRPKSIKPKQVSLSEDISEADTEPFVVPEKIWSYGGGSE